ncbi:MAG: hypothetical protein Q9165_003494 [Trypethelium subeluteriae]
MQVPLPDYLRLSEARDLWRSTESRDGHRNEIHNQSATRALMAELYDPQMCNVADFDCFSQVVFETVDDYKRMKQDPWYKEHLTDDHEKFADTKKSMNDQSARVIIAAAAELVHKAAYPAKQFL